MPITGTPDDDSLIGTANDDVISGLDGDDNLFGNGGSDTLNGGADNDYLDGGTGSDLLNGGAGDDLIIASLGDTIDGGSGKDVADIDLSSVAAAMTFAFDFTGGVVNTLVEGTSFKNIEILDITTGAGNDTISYDSSAIYGAGSPAPKWTGGAGEDHVIVDWSDQRFSMYGGTNGISLGSTHLSFLQIERFDYYGGSGHDTFGGGALADTFVGNGGNDTLTGGGGDDTLSGGDGSDNLYGGNAANNQGIDTLNGGDGDDEISAAYKDTIEGGDGLDALTLDLSDRTEKATLDFDPSAVNKILTTRFSNIEQLFLSTGIGNDKLSFGSSAIWITVLTDGSWSAGAGTDTVTVDFSDQMLSVAAALTSVQIADFRFTFNGVEVVNFTGGSGNDTLTGGAAADVLTSNAGNDNLFGYGGKDTLTSGDGRDTVYGGDANDTINGGDDRDTLSGEAGDDTINGGAGGGSGRDTIYGGDGNDDLSGGAGNDEIRGGAGGDDVDGGSGSDVVWFSAVADTTSVTFDTVANFDFAADRFHFDDDVAEFEGTLSTGALNEATFDADLAAAVNSLGSHNVVLLTPDAGDLAGSVFVVADANGTAGYQANEDYVIRLVTPANIAQADVMDFLG